jgi:hypothetical protein
MIIKNSIKTFGGFLMLSLIFLFACPAITFAQSSENFKITRSVVAQGGTSSQTSQYKVKDVIGQPVSGGKIFSSLYQVTSGFFPLELPTQVAISPFEIPNSFMLLQNYPNPFNPETSINYQLPEKVAVKIAIFNLRGQQIRTLQNRVQEQGYHSVRWDGHDEAGYKVVSGIYLYRIKAGEYASTKKMALMK